MGIKVALGADLGRNLRTERIVYPSNAIMTAIYHKDNITPLPCQLYLRSE